MDDRGFLATSTRHIGRIVSILVIAVLFLPISLHAAPTTQSRFSLTADDSGPHDMTVANWSFSVKGAVKAPTFSEVIHLGMVDDGRHWLAVTFEATNTSGEDQSIHSDMIQLRVGAEEIKQTGAESEGAAAEIGYMSIGGSWSHTIAAGDTINVLQVYKVQPGSSTFWLVFDFQGQWEMPIHDLVSESDGDPRALIGESADTDPSTDENPSPTDPWVVTTPNFRVTLIGATTAPTFRGPFHLGALDDGRHWLVVTYSVQNTTSDEKEFQSDSVTLLSAGESINQAGDETRSVAGETSLVAPSEDIEGESEITFVQVFKVSPNVLDNTLAVSGGGTWYINLRPVLEATAGAPETVLPDSALNLSEITQYETVAQAAPTPAPTPTPEPTAIPEQGSEERPASQNESLINGPWLVEISDVQTESSLNYGYATPRPGFKFVLVTIFIANGGDSGNDFGSGDFVLINPVNNEEYSSEFLNFAPTPLEGGRLGVGEYTYGQLVYEVPISAETAVLRFRPSIFGDASHWTITIP